MDPVFDPKHNNPVYNTFSVGLAMRRGWFIYTQRPLLFILLSAMGIVPYISHVISHDEKEIIENVLLDAATSLFHSFFVTAGAAYAVARIRQSTPVPFEDAVCAGVRRFPSLLPLAIAGMAVLLTTFHWGWRYLPHAAMLPVLACAILFQTRLLFAIHVCVVEKLGAWASIRKSWELTAGHFWQMVGLVLYTIAAVIAGFVILSALYAMFVRWGQHDTSDNIFTFCIITLVDSVITACYAAAYFDLRGEKEGEAIHGMRQVFD